MRKILLVLLFILPGLMHAQIRFAPRLGFNLANIVTRPYYSDEKKYSGAYLARMNAGFMTEIPLNDNDNWFLYTGLYYSGKGYRDDITRPRYSFDTTITYLNYIEIPANIAFKFSKDNENRFIAFIGPYAAYGFKGKIIYHNNPSLTKRNLHRSDSWYKRIDIGMAAGIMYEIKKRFSVRAEYTRSLFDISRSRYKWKQNNNVFSLSFLCYLKKHKEPEEE